jgi:hypothetical protein
MIMVKFYCDPLVSDGWPRPEREWKEKEFAIAARCIAATQGLRFEQISRWAPANTPSAGSWGGYSHFGLEAHSGWNLGVEEKAGNMADLSRMAWELESI